MTSRNLGWVENYRAKVDMVEGPADIGHSFGGTLTQLLLALGLRSTGVVIDSAPTRECG